MARRGGGIRIYSFFPSPSLLKQTGRWANGVYPPATLLFQEGVFFAGETWSPGLENITINLELIQTRGIRLFKKPSVVMVLTEMLTQRDFCPVL